MGTIRVRFIIVALVVSFFVGAALMIDLLPAGFEVENARLADTRSTNDLAWLPELTPTLYSEYLDDRRIRHRGVGQQDGLEFGGGAPGLQSARICGKLTGQCDTGAADPARRGAVTNVPSAARSTIGTPYFASNCAR